MTMGRLAPVYQSPENRISVRFIGPRLVRETRKRYPEMFSIVHLPHLGMLELSAVFQLQAVDDSLR